jgi:hypothetical protein
MIEGGKYAAKDVPVGPAKVEIRVPDLKKEGGRGFPEALPAKYNDQTELTFEIKPGKNEKNWDIVTKDK